MGSIKRDLDECRKQASPLPQLLITHLLISPKPLYGEAKTERYLIF
jgi:hypothetical protein